MYGKRLDEIDKIDLEKVTGKELLDLKKEIGKKKIVSATVLTAEMVAAIIVSTYFNNMDEFNYTELNYTKHFIRYLLELFGGFVYLELLLHGARDFRKSLETSLKIKGAIKHRVEQGGEN